MTLVLEWRTRQMERQLVSTDTQEDKASGNGQWPRNGQRVVELQGPSGNPVGRWKCMKFLQVEMVLKRGDQLFLVYPGLDRFEHWKSCTPGTPSAWRPHDTPPGRHSLNDKGQRHRMGSGTGCSVQGRQPSMKKCKQEPNCRWLSNPARGNRFNPMKTESYWWF